MTSESTEVLADTVLEELGRDSRLDASRVSLSARDGSVTLRGRVRSYSEKCCAESIVRELRGVVAVHNAIEVRLSVGNYRTDAGLAHLTNEMLENHAVFTDDPPRATVDEGWVILRGVVASEVHKQRAEAIVRDLAGIRGIINEIEVIPQSDAGQAKPAFEAALRRRASIAVEELLVDVSGMTMAVYGQVRSCAERDELITLASRTRGIARVDDHVTVRPAETSGRMG